MGTEALEDTAVYVGSQTAFGLAAVVALGCLWYSFYPQGGAMDDKDVRDILSKLDEIKQSIQTLKSRIDSMHQDIRNLQGAVSNRRD